MVQLRLTCTAPAPARTGHAVTKKLPSAHPTARHAHAALSAYISTMLHSIDSEHVVAFCLSDARTSMHVESSETSSFCVHLLQGACKCAS